MKNILINNDKAQNRLIKAAKHLKEIQSFYTIEYGKLYENYKNLQCDYGQFIVFEKELKLKLKSARANLRNAAQKI